MTKLSKKEFLKVFWEDNTLMSSEQQWQWIKAYAQQEKKEERRKIIKIIDNLQVDYDQDDRMWGVAVCEDIKLIINELR